MTELKRMVIRFGDNDFYYALLGVAETLVLKETLGRDSSLPTDKEKLSFIVNEIFFGCYVVFQNTFEYNGLESMNEEFISHMRKYLTIDPKNIFINEEADKYVSDNESDNGESVYIDLENSQYHIF